VRAISLWLGEHGIAATVAVAVAGQSVTDLFTRPEEVADLVLWLAGGRAGNVTGTDIVIGGDLIATL
jgi:NAD(P)-dependent dehydrogenase (short-subunit alcohol dehydrogenase family)